MNGTKFIYVVMFNSCSSCFFTEAQPFVSVLPRGKGPLKNTSDVISAAKKIAEAGSRMDKLGRTIADNVSFKKLSQKRA